MFRASGDRARWGRGAHYAVAAAFVWLLGGACGDITTTDVPTLPRTDVQSGSTGGASPTGGTTGGTMGPSSGGTAGAAAGGATGVGGTAGPPVSSTGGMPAPPPSTGGHSGSGGAAGAPDGPIAADVATCVAKCHGNMKVCNVFTLTCVECLSDADCPGHKTCAADLSCAK